MGISNILWLPLHVRYLRLLCFAQVIIYKPPSRHTTGQPNQCKGYSIPHDSLLSCFALSRIINPSKAIEAKP